MQRELLAQRRPQPLLRFAPLRMTGEIGQIIVGDGLTKEFDLAAGGFDRVTHRIGAEILHKDVGLAAFRDLNEAARPELGELRKVDAFARMRRRALR